MAAIMQMGHGTENLFAEQELEGFKRVVLSPLNRTPLELEEDVSNFRSKGCDEVVFDPQLYYPKTSKKTLKSHPYFPEDFHTADQSEITWWKRLNSKIAKYASSLAVDTCISPAMQPKVWKDEYFVNLVAIANDLSTKKGERSNCLMCLPIGTGEFDDQDTAPRVASIVSQTLASGFYVVFVTDLEPRREIYDEAELLGMMHLVHDLKRTGKRVVVAFAGPEMLLLKCAGADDVGTGKFFNLRRYSPGRYEEPAGGGGQVEYWFAERLLAYLRTRDVLQLLEEGKQEFLTGGFSSGKWAREILEQLRGDEGKAWLRLSWRQYLSWFWRIEERLCSADPSAVTSPLLKAAEDNWQVLDDANILMDEVRNNGAWLRPWRKALIAFNRAITPK